jgi:hypothetical protein
MGPDGRSLTVNRLLIFRKTYSYLVETLKPIINYKVALVPWKHAGGVEVKLHTFVTLALQKDEFRYLYSRQYPNG